jgi:hypothetical protein
LFDPLLFRLTLFEGRPGGKDFEFNAPFDLLACLAFDLAAALGLPFLPPTKMMVRCPCLWVLATWRLGDVLCRRFVDLVVDCLLSSCPTVAAANDGAPNVPAVNRINAAEQKLFRINI